MEMLPQILVSGIAMGAIYSLVALGFVLIYKSSHIFNIAQGEFLLLGAYVCWAFWVQLSLPVWLGALLTLAVAVILGLLVERFAMRPLIGQPLLAMIMVTVALASLLKGVAAMLWSGIFHSYPTYLGNALVTLGPA